MIAAGRKDERRFFQMLRFIQCIDAIDGTLELAGKTVVIDGGSQHNHLRLIQQRINLLHIVLLNALPLMAGIFFVAVFTGKTSCNFLPADIYHIHLMAVFPRAFCESRRHGCGISVRPGTAV